MANAETRRDFILILFCNYIFNKMLRFFAYFFIILNVYRIICLFMLRINSGKEKDLDEILKNCLKIINKK